MTPDLKRSAITYDNNVLVEALIFLVEVNPGELITHIKSIDILLRSIEFNSDYVITWMIRAGSNQQEALQRIIQDSKLGVSYDHW